MGARVRTAMASPLQPGDTYGEFEVLEVLGSGAFAWVYSARSERYGEPVALKLSNMPVVSKEQAVRALREIRILEAIQNEHVVDVIDHGLGPDDHWYMVMELLEGGELSSLHDFDDPLEPDEAVRIVYQACLGLEDAHRAGIVHRDIKPSNLWRLPSGEIKIIDFGLARSWGDDSIIGANATQGNMLVGTPHYAQPEQIQTGRLTPASDIYSLAFVLYELLTGRTPLFEDRRCSEVRNRLADDPMGWLAAHVERSVVPLEHYPEGAALPAGLRSLIMRALDKDPAARPATGAQMADALRWYLPARLGGFAGTTVLMLELEDDDGPSRSFAMSPGTQRIGLGPCCEIELGEDPVGWVWAEITWPGPRRDPILKPIRNDGWVSVDGVSVSEAVDLPAGSVIGLGNQMLTLSTRRA